MTPDPRLRSRRGPRSGSKKNRKNGSEKNGAVGPCSVPRTVFEEEMLTTAGITAFATAVQPLAGGPGCASTTRGAERSNGHHHRGPPPRGQTSSATTSPTATQKTSWLPRHQNHV